MPENLSQNVKLIFRFRKLRSVNMIWPSVKCLTFVVKPLFFVILLG